MAIIAFHGASALPTHSTVLAAAGRVDLESGWHGAKALRSSTTHRRRDARRRPGRPPHKIACLEFERADSSTTRSPRPLTITRPGLRQAGDRSRQPRRDALAIRAGQRSRRDPPQALPAGNHAFRGEMARTVLNMLRQARKPLPAHDTARAFMVGWGLATADKPLFRVIQKHVGACARNYCNKGIVRSIDGPARMVREIVR